MIRQSIFLGLLLLTCGYALWRGRTYERMAALVCIGATAISVLLHTPVAERYHGIELGDLLVDSAVLVAFVAIALRSDRFWPLWIAGLQLTLSMSHLFKAIEPDLLPRAYAVAERFWSYPILVIVFIGAWRQHRRTQERADLTPT
jgi:hypothetical protein